MIALVLALGIGSLGRAPAAQAAPARISDIFTFDMRLTAPKARLCTGETAHYTATVYRSFKSAPPGSQSDKTPKPIEIAGVNVTASAPKSLGSFSGAKSSDTLEGSVSQQTGFNLDAVYSVEFEFTAGSKPGGGTLNFNGTVKGYGVVSTWVEVEVIACKYEVSTNSLWVYSTPNGTAIAIEFMKALLTGGDGGSFNSSGSPTVLWIATEFIPNYGSSVTISKGSALVRGQATGFDPDRDGKLLIYLTFNPVSGNEKICGPAGCGGGALSLSAEPVVIPVPLEGGSGTGWHKLTGNGKQISGYTKATVKVLDASK